MEHTNTNSVENTETNPICTGNCNTNPMELNIDKPNIDKLNIDTLKTLHLGDLQQYIIKNPDVLDKLITNVDLQKISLINITQVGNRMFISYRINETSPVLDLGFTDVILKENNYKQLFVEEYKKALTQNSAEQRNDTEQINTEQKLHKEEHRIPINPATALQLEDGKTFVTSNVKTDGWFDDQSNNQTNFGNFNESADINKNIADKSNDQNELNNLAEQDKVSSLHYEEFEQEDITLQDIQKLFKHSKVKTRIIEQQELLTHTFVPNEDELPQLEAVIKLYNKYKNLCKTCKMPSLGIERPNNIDEIIKTLSVYSEILALSQKYELIKDLLDFPITAQQDRLVDGEIYEKYYNLLTESGINMKILNYLKQRFYTNKMLSFYIMYLAIIYIKANIPIFIQTETLKDVTLLHEVLVFTIAYMYFLL